jgi:DnaJ-class molecular chaperone
MSAEFLAQLAELAIARHVAATQRPGPRCKICKGTGSREKYVLPGVVGPAECVSCNGTGVQPSEK